MKSFKVTVYVEKAIVMTSSDHTKEQAQESCQRILANEGYNIIRTEIVEEE